MSKLLGASHMLAQAKGMDPQNMALVQALSDTEFRLDAIELVISQLAKKMDLQRAEVGPAPVPAARANEVAKARYNSTKDHVDRILKG